MLNFQSDLFVVVLIFLLKSCEVTCDIQANSTKVRRSIIEPYGLPPFAPFGAIPSFGAFLPPSPPSFPPSPFLPPFSPPLGPPFPLPPPPVLPSPFAPPFPLPFYPPGPPSPQIFYPFPYPHPALPLPPPPPPPPPPPATVPAPTPIILPAHTAATLSVASLLHALIAKKFYPPVVPFPVPRPVPFPVTVKIPVPVPVPVEQPQHVTILKPADHIDETINHEDPNHEKNIEWHSSPPNEWHLSPPDVKNDFAK